MSWIRLLVVFMSGLVSVSSAHARKFDFKSESLATYIRGGYGSSSVGDAPFANSSGSSVTFDKAMTSHASGEFGFLFSGDSLNFRIGAEVLVPRSLSGVEGKNAGGTTLFTLDSRIVAVIPMGSVEFAFKRGTVWKALVGLGAGFANMTMTNDYNFTATGLTVFPAGDYSERSTSTATVLHIYSGFEFLFADNVTLMIDAGYRHVTSGLWKLSNDTNALWGTGTSGETVKNMDGTDRTINLSSPYVGLNLRFYLGI